jgi:hypothetical protein
VVRVTHPFHPLRGAEFPLLSVGRTWGAERVFFLDQDGVRRSLPLAWTDAAAPDPSVVVAAGRAPFRLEDLEALAALAEGLGR